MEMHQIVTDVLSDLKEADYRRLNEQLKQIQKLNNDITETDKLGFIYLGEVYLPQGVSGTIGARGQRKSLHPSLFPKMREYIADKTFIDNELNRIKKLLALVLFKLDSLQDIRDALPDKLASIAGVSSLSRTNSIENMCPPELKEEYLKVINKIEIMYMSRIAF